MKKIWFIICLTLASGFVRPRNLRRFASGRYLIVFHEDFSTLNQAENISKAAGDSAYLRNDYLAAIQNYESLLQQGESAEVYYNLGNSYYKSGDIARAILNYERALLLSQAMETFVSIWR